MAIQEILGPTRATIMFDNVHLIFVLHAPTSGGLTCSRLFELMDGLDDDVLDDLLIDFYLAYDIRESQKLGKRYADFKRAFLAANKTCKDENVVVFGLVSYVLAEAFRKGDTDRFNRILDDHQTQLVTARDELRKEGLPASQIIQNIYELEERICSRRREYELSHRSYKLFCDEVVALLVRNAP